MTPELTPEGLAVLDDALDWIAEHPEQHDQGVWFSRDSGCGTTACLAGTIAFRSGALPVLDQGLNDRVQLPDGTHRFVEEYAAQLLGVDVESRVVDHLFYDAEGVEDLRRFRDEYAAELEPKA